MSDTNRFVTSEHLGRCGIGTPEGVLSSSDKDVATLLQAAISIELLALVPHNTTPRKSRFDGLFSVEVKSIAHAVGISEKHLKKFLITARTGTKRGVFERTERADESIVKHMNAAEDIAPDRENLSQFRPYSGLIIHDADLDRIADRLEHIMGKETERLLVLDTYRRTQRIVRHVIRIAGGRTSIPVKFGHPSILCVNVATNRPVIGTTAVDVATRELEKALAEDNHFQAPIERFWRISDLVLTSLGATVNYNFPEVFK